MIMATIHTNGANKHKPLNAGIVSLASQLERAITIDLVKLSLTINEVFTNVRLCRAVNNNINRMQR
ncbi:hypothetical protein DA11_21195 [Aeromonas caviae]|nr:hypothetical protein DA11_21195 [Aeromonas caviae]